MFTNDSQKPEGDLSVKLNPGVLLHRHCYLAQNALINVLYLLFFPTVFFKQCLFLMNIFFLFSLPILARMLRKEIF